MIFDIPNTYTNILSITLFIVSFIVFKKYSLGALNKSFFILFSFANICLFAIFKVSDYFTGNGVDHATIVLLKFGLVGAALGQYIWLISLTSGLLLISLFLLVIFTFRRGRYYARNSLKNYSLAYILLVLSLLSNPGSINLYNLPPGTFITSRASSDSAGAEFYKYYKRPKIKEISNKHKNIVVIYAESLERALFNEEIFPDLVRGIKQIEKNSISFTNMSMARYNGGTIWAIVGGQCGLPLFLPSRALLNQGTGDFFPLATCLGDLLAEEGYYLSFYGGADLKFTRKGDFFESHGFGEVQGKRALRSKLKDKDYLNYWGLYDDSLLDITYKRFLELSKTKKKFGLFTLTLDTHSPGYASKTCENKPYQNGENKQLNAFTCSDILISQFIDKISNSPYASQTLIVLQSDHISWNDSSAGNLLKKARDGDKNIFMIIEPGSSRGKQIATKGTDFDIGPTILPFLGYSGDIGLGRNLLEETNESEHERSIIQSRLHAWRGEILKYWDQPKIRKSISIDLRKKSISIDRKNYIIPIYIELTSNLESSLLFGFNEGFFRFVEKMEEYKKYLMVGECSRIKTSGNYFSEDGVAIADEGWCLITGQGTRLIYKKKLDENTSYNIQELQEILEIKN